MCKERAEKDGYVVVNCYSDHAISGASMMRPGIQMMMQDAASGQFNAVHAEALDRVSRDQEDIEAIFKRLSFSRRYHYHLVRRRDFTAAYRPQRHDECAIPQRPCRQDS